jgi:hypothetical protein
VIPEGTDIVVASNKYPVPKKILESAMSRRIRVVSHLWLVEAIIGRLPESSFQWLDSENSCINDKYKGVRNTRGLRYMTWKYRGKLP